MKTKLKVETKNQDLSRFTITDSTRRLHGSGTDGYCLDLILDFIRASDSPRNISLSWNWFEINDDDTVEENDLVVIVYDRQERAEMEDCGTFPSAMSNWDYAQEVIEKELIARSEKLEKK